MQTLQNVILHMTTTHVLCVYTSMHCALSCICLCHVLVCAGGMLASVLQFFMVLVQQAITGITFEVLFEVRRHQHSSISTNLRMITKASLFLVLFDYSLILYFFFGVCICLIVLQLSLFLSFCHCPFSVHLHLFSALLTSPSLPPPPIPLRSWRLHLPSQGGPTASATRALQLQDWWSTSKHSTWLQSVWAWSALSSPHKHAKFLFISAGLSDC